MYKKIFLVISMSLSIGVFASSVLYCLTNSGIRKLVLTENMETIMESAFPGKSLFREIYGAANLILSPHEIASDGQVVIKDKDKFLHNTGLSEFDVKKAESEIKELEQVCHENGAEFAYISYPSKADSDTVSEHYGIDTNNEELRIELLSQLKENKINVLNVRELLEHDGYSKTDIFYKTDHHWKSTAGLYAAKAMADYMNRTFHYSLRTDLLEDSQFMFTEHKKLWLGETGRKVSKTWAGVLDDFVEIRPVYDTSLELNDESGDFSMLVNDSGYNGEEDLYTYSAHYSYGKSAASLSHIHNNNVGSKKILIIKDSFSVVVIPFLSLVVSDVSAWDVRTTPEGLYDYIAENDFDLVMVAYTEHLAMHMYDFR